MTLEEFWSNQSNCYLSFATSNDTQQLVERFMTAQVPEKNKVITIVGLGVFSVVEGDKTRLDRTVPGSIAGILAAIMGGSPMNDAFHLVICPRIDVLDRDCQASFGALKAVADGTLTTVCFDRTTGSNLVNSTSQLAGALGTTPEPAQGRGRPRGSGRASDFADGEICKSNNKANFRVMITSPSSEIPPSLADVAYAIGNVDNKVSNEAYAVGMTTRQKMIADQVMALLNGKIDRSQTISKIRKSTFGSNGVVRDIDYIENPDDIGGFEKVKEYFGILNKYIKNEKESKLKIKGSLFVGPAGTAKSKILTAIPKMLDLPGYMLDFNRASGSLHGQTERQLLQAIDTAKKYAPVVICIDEIEKAVAGTGAGEVAGNEVATKILGILLTAMAEDSNIYWVASANKVKHLPAPLLRRGRWDHLWYVPLPGDENIAKIIGIHCRKCNIEFGKVEDAKFEKMVHSMRGLVGAEIQHCIKEVAVKAIANNKKPTYQDIEKELSLIKNRVADHTDTKDVQEWGLKYAIPID